MENLPSNATYSTNPSFHWAEAPKVRGSLQILNLCFSTLLICTWNALHLDIPLKRQSPPRRFFLTIYWMFAALLAPEALLGIAIFQRWIASTLSKKAVKLLPSRQPPAQPGTLTRVYNYFCRREKLKDERENLVEKASSTRKYPFGLVHAFYAVMSGFIFDVSPDEEGVEESANRPSAKSRDAPTPETFLYIMQNFPDIIPDISEESITDRGQSGGMGKAVLIAQVGWFCANCTSRLVEGLPLSLLEVSTAAHGFCTLLTYFVWWYKPLNIAVSTPMRGCKAREVHALLQCTEEEYLKALEVARNQVSNSPVISEGQETPANVPTSETHGIEPGRVDLAGRALKDLLPSPPARPEEPFHHHDSVSSPGYSGNDMVSDRMASIVIITTPLLYGVLHFLGWNEVFPIPREHLLWGISTVTITSSGFLSILIIEVSNLIGISDNIPVIITAIIFILHLIASGFLAVESVRQLFFLPPAAYELPSWFNFWPHFS